MEMKLFGEIVERVYEYDSKTKDVKNVGLVIGNNFNSISMFWIPITHYYHMLIFELDNTNHLVPNPTECYSLIPRFGFDSSIHAAKSFTDIQVAKQPAGDVQFNHTT